MANVPSKQIPDNGQKCSCCGGTMELEGKVFATRITIEGKNYFCNNPACYCENPKDKGDKKS